MIDNIKFYFGRFKVATVISYLCFFTMWLFGVIFEGNTKELLQGIAAISYLVSVLFWWRFLYKCAILIGKKPLHYYILIIIPFFGQAIAYLMLQKASLSIYSVTK